MTLTRMLLLLNFYVAASSSQYENNYWLCYAVFLATLVMVHDTVVKSIWQNYSSWTNEMTC